LPKGRVATIPGNSWNAVYLLENVKTPGSQFFEIQLTCNSLIIHPIEANLHYLSIKLFKPKDDYKLNYID